MTDHSELVARLRDMGIQCCDLAADAIEALAEKNAALRVTYDDLYADALEDAKSDAHDFDGDLWQVVRDYLTRLDFDWTYHIDGVTADCAIEFIRESMDDETRRADRAEAENAALKARAEAGEAKVARADEALTKLRDLMCEAIEDDDWNSGCGQCEGDCTGCIAQAALREIGGQQ